MLSCGQTQKYHGRKLYCPQFADENTEARKWLQLNAEPFPFPSHLSFLTLALTSAHLSGVLTHSLKCELMTPSPPMAWSGLPNNSYHLLCVCECALGSLSNPKGGIKSSGENICREVTTLFPLYELLDHSWVPTHARGTWERGLGASAE